MINLYYSSSGQQHTAIWPEVTASEYPINTASASFVLEVTQEYDRSSGSIDLTLANTPNRYSPRMVFSLNRSDVPQFSGQYNTQLIQYTSARPVWGSTERKWSLANWQWSSTFAPVSQSIIDQDRAWVSGSDFATFDVYTSSSTETIYDSGSAYPATEYVSPDENGTYTTYHV